MKMISVAPTLEETPQELRDWHVGGLEAGMGAAMREMADLLEANRLEEVLGTPSGLRDVCFEL